MSTSSAAPYEPTHVSPRETSVREISPFQQLFWSVQRELWENRSIYLVPLAAAAVALFGFIVSPFGLRKLGTFTQLETSPLRQSVAGPYDAVAGVIMLSGMIVSIVYCLDALYGERRDRSILFWKSLPVSDGTTVLAKAAIPLLVLPVVIFATTVVTQLMMLLLSSAVLLSYHFSVSPLWSLLAPFRMWWMLLYHLFAVHALWYAPLYAWLLLVSAWARRTPFLWAFLPPLAVGIFEKIVWNTTHLAEMLRNRLSGGTEGVTHATPGAMPLDPGMNIALGSYLGAAGLWIGLIIAALFIGLCVRLRRYREPI